MGFMLLLWAWQTKSHCSLLLLKGWKTNSGPERETRETEEGPKQGLKMQTIFTGLINPSLEQGVR